MNDVYGHVSQQTSTSLPGSGRGGWGVTPLRESHHQSLFIHEIVSFYMVFLGIVFKTRLKYSKELLTIML